MLLIFQKGILMEYNKHILDLENNCTISVPQVEMANYKIVLLSIITNNNNIYKHKLLLPIQLILLFSF